MRSKNNYKLIILLALVLFLSIGYAVVNSVSLTISGKTGAQNYNLKVQTTGNTYISNPTKGKIVKLTSNEITVEVNDMELNETISFEVELVNNETDVSATSANEIFDSSNNKYFFVDCRIGDGLSGTSQPFEVKEYCDSFTIPPGGKRTALITIKLIKTPITEEDAKATFSYTTNMIPSN